MDDGRPLRLFQIKLMRGGRRAAHEVVAGGGRGVVR